MAATDPAIMLNIGKGIKINRQKWADEEKNVMERELLAKFSQEQHLLTELLYTEKRHFVEANKYDKHWGIGRGLKDPALQTTTSWPGKKHSWQSDGSGP